jgi:hypothetical protein
MNQVYPRAETRPGRPSWQKILDTVKAHWRVLRRMVQPETQYARLVQDRIAYRSLEEDHRTHAYPLSSVDLAWEQPGVALFLRLT